MMSLRLRIIIGVAALSLALLGVVGDDLFQAMGFPARSGRAIVAITLLVLGLGWFAWTSVRWRRDMDIINGRRKPKPEDERG